VDLLLSGIGFNHIFFDLEEKQLLKNQDIELLFQTIVCHLKHPEKLTQMGTILIIVSGPPNILSYHFSQKNLLEQFHRVVNLYFICIVLLNWVPAINALGKEIAMIPVLFVLGVTAIKDLFKDRRRHTSDKRINNLTCQVHKR